MRSPPVSCCPATREPPINRVPKTMPARGKGQVVSKEATRSRGQSPAQVLDPSSNPCCASDRLKCHQVTSMVSAFVSSFGKEWGGGDAWAAGTGQTSEGHEAHEHLPLVRLAGTVLPCSTLIPSHARVLPRPGWGLAHSQLKAMLESPWNKAMPRPSSSALQRDSSSSAP